MSTLNDSNITMELLSNPLNLQQTVMTDLHTRLGGNRVIVDPNSVSMHLIEMSSNLTANFATACENTTSGLVATRAQTIPELYKFMSDYDYVNLFGSPSQIEANILLDKDYLLKNALDYNEQYKKIIIPRYTKFTVGSYEFGIYYPIEIRINKHTKSCVVIWDTDEEFPSQDLKANVIPFIENYIAPYTLLQLKIPLYQFSIEKYKESLTSDTGFNKQYSFRHRFYLVRLFTTIDNSRIELSQTLDSGNYDPLVPTARLVINQDRGTLGINIPQVYFTNGLLGPSLEVEIYTTLGSLNTDISKILPENCQMEFGLTKTSSEYSNVLNNITVLALSPISTSISGGTNGYGYTELRRRVLNSSFHTSLLVTPMDISNFFEDNGMKIVKYEDNVTNLLFFAYKSLIDSTGTIIPSTDVAIKITEDNIKNVSTILEQDDGTITIMPNTLYKYSTGLNATEPLIDSEVTKINNADKVTKVDIFNNINYTKSPFHIRVIPDGKYPIADSYDLMSPSISNLKFEMENDNMSAQMVAIGGGITHLSSGTDSYRMIIGVNKSKDLLEIPEEHIVVYLTTRANNGTDIGIRMNYIGVENNQYMYDSYIETNYNIDRDNNIAILNLTEADEPWPHYVPLSHEYTLVFLVKSTYFPGISQDLELSSGVSVEYTSGYIPMVRQSMNVTLGVDISDVIFNSIDIQYSSTEYARYQTDEPLLYTTDVYETDEHGVPVYTLDAQGKVVFTVIHTKGDPVLDDNGQPVYKHKTGDVIKDDYGLPVPSKSRITEYYIDAPMIDAKLYMSDQQVHKDYVKQIPSILNSYFSTIRNAKDNLLERDDIFFKLIKTLGSTQFNIGDGQVVTYPLGMSFSFRCHVDSSTIKDPVALESIKNVIISEIDTALLNKRISAVEISNSVISKVSYVKAVDVLGINGSTNLQTLVVVDDSAQPSIEQELYLTDNGTISIRKNVDVTFVSTT